MNKRFVKKEMPNNNRLSLIGGRKGKTYIVGVDVGAGPDYSCQATVKFEKGKITVLKVKRIC